MKRLALLLVVATAGAFALVANAQAHPLGNFTINQYSRIQPSGNRLYVLYALDLAEIPTFQAKPQVAAGGTDAYADRLVRSIRRNVDLTVDGRRAALGAPCRSVCYDRAPWMPTARSSTSVTSVPSSRSRSPRHRCAGSSRRRA